jgi:hypothetical protein
MSERRGPEMDDSRIIKTEYSEEMQKSFIDYAMSVIAARALPDVRDGLKPVQRRILYSMIELNNGPDKPHRKCARIVGTIIQFYHGIQYTSLNRFQTISYIRQCSGSDNAHGIVNIRVLHGLFQIHLVDFVKNIIFDLSILPIIRYPDSLQILHSLQ